VMNENDELIEIQGTA